MPGKKFYLPAKDIKQLIEHSGGCIASDRITVDGSPVGYMYREPPHNDADMGWRFMAGDETDEYMADPNNHSVHAVNTIANYDNEILPLINGPIGSAFARNPDTGEFESVESPVDPDDCLHPDFPVVTGHFQLTSAWSLFLPFKFNCRIENGSLILWRLGITLYFKIWNNDHNESIATRLATLKRSISPDAFELGEQQAGSSQRFSYRLIEEGVNALYGFVVADSGQLKVAVYFDAESDIDLARSMFASVTENTS